MNGYQLSQRVYGVPQNLVLDRDVDNDTVRVSHYEHGRPAGASADHPGEGPRDSVLSEAR